MTAVLLVVGLLATTAGFVMVGFGIPNNAFGLGNTLILAGSTSIAAGLVLIGLAAVHSQLRKMNAVFYRTLSGREPVRDWLKSLTREDRKVIGEDIVVVQLEWPLGRPQVDHLREGIWELRSRLDKRHARLLFTATSGEIVFLHGFIKKTRATPSEEIALAERRWKIWQDLQQGDEGE